MSGKTTIKPNTTSKGSYTQMFLDNDDRHFIDAEHALSYNEVLSWGGRKHSEGMMPFISDEPFEYPTMDYLWPIIPPYLDTPYLPPYTPPYTTPGLPFGRDYGGPNHPAYRFNCIISCDHLVRDCDSPVRCHYGAFTIPVSVDNWEIISPGPTEISYGNIVNLDDRDPTRGIKITPPQGSWKMSEAGALPGTSGLHFNIAYHDGGGGGGWFWQPPPLGGRNGRLIYITGGASVCTDHTWINCCPADEPLTYDTDNTPATIEPGGSINLYITGGVPPFQWAVEGTGYSLTTSETSGSLARSNGLHLVDGACGVDYSPYVKITITDYCDEEVTGFARAVGGSWSGWELLVYVDHDEICGGTCQVGGTYTHSIDVECEPINVRYRRYSAVFYICSGSDPDDCCGDGEDCGYDSSNPPYVFLCDQVLCYEFSGCSLFCSPFYATICRIELEWQYWEC